MPGDVLSGRYPLTAAFAKGVGGQTNGAAPNLPPRSNAEPGFVLPSIGTGQDAAAALTSGSMTLVPVPVEIGDLYSSVDVLVGATAAGTPTHSFAGIYNAAGTLVASSADGTTAAIAAGARFTFTLTTAYLANTADAPGGFVYVGISVTATTAPSLVSGNVPTAAQYLKYTADPAFYAGTIGSALGGTVPTSEVIGNVTRQAAVPVVFLR